LDINIAYVFRRSGVGAESPATIVGEMDGVDGTGGAMLLWPTIISFERGENAFLRAVISRSQRCIRQLKYPKF
jgi:hypothetical protein